MHLRGVPFIKKLYVVCGMCMQVYALRNAHDVISSLILCIQGWGTTRALAGAVALAEIYHGALQRGILQQTRLAKCCPLIQSALTHSCGCPHKDTHIDSGGTACQAQFEKILNHPVTK